MEIVTNFKAVTHNNQSTGQAIIARLTSNSRYISCENSFKSNQQQATTT